MAHQTTSSNTAKPGEAVEVSDLSNGQDGYEISGRALHMLRLRLAPDAPVVRRVAVARDDLDAVASWYTCTRSLCDQRPSEREPLVYSFASSGSLGALGALRALYEAEAGERPG